MKSLFKICPAIFASLYIFEATTVTSAQLSPGLERLLSQQPADTVLTVLVYADDLAIINTAPRVVDNATRHDRINEVTSHLKATNHRLTEDMLRLVPGATVIRKFWAVPAVLISASHTTLQRLSNTTGIRAIIENVEIELIAPVSSVAAPALSTSVAAELHLLGVPTVWQRGITGRGRLVCSFDTGVESAHPALWQKWRGQTAGLGAAWHSSVKPDTLPYDKAGHGTHTMGIMVGSQAADSFGVAPGAEWISAGVIDQGHVLHVTISDILAAFEWALDPDGNPATTDDVPDVILNSWGIPTGLLGYCDDTFWSVIDNVEAAGIVTVFAAGNEGPNAMSVRNPADRASSPLNAMSVGAVDNGGTIAAFSSRGPSSCDSASIKPEIVAPGMSVRSCARGGGYTFMSGTSMAAPYIAGLVALCREYNPNATVAQIKNAFILAARDLGQPGEDNAYGHGLVDAAKLFDYLPIPQNTIFNVVSQSTTTDNRLLPGVATNLTLYLSQTGPGISSLVGELIPAAGVTYSNSVSTFIFGAGGSTSVNAVPLSLTLHKDTPHGGTKQLILVLRTTSGLVVDSVTVSIPIGYAAPGLFADGQSTNHELTVSDFGQHGLGPGSIYNVGGRGFRFKNSGNLLYESAVIVGRSSLQLSSAARDGLGRFRPSDFSPVSTLSVTGSPVLETRSVCEYTDRYSTLPIPLNIREEIIQFATPSGEAVIIVIHRIINSSLERLTNLHVGLLIDFDLPGGEFISRGPVEKLVVTTDGAGTYLGVAGIAQISHLNVLPNSGPKKGLSNSELYGHLSASVSTAYSVKSDYFTIISSDRFNLNPQDTMEVAYVMMAAANEAGILSAYLRAQERFDSPTTIDDEPELPSSFSLGQNYPNPFNPSTTIRFALETTAPVSLTVHNVLGQLVATLIAGTLSAAEHNIVWDGTNGLNEPVASGVYFYTLQSGSHRQTRKMALLR